MRGENQQGFVFGNYTHAFVGFILVTPCVSQRECWIWNSETCRRLLWGSRENHLCHWQKRLGTNLQVAADNSFEDKGGWQVVASLPKCNTGCGLHHTEPQVLALLALQASRTTVRQCTQGDHSIPGNGTKKSTSQWSSLARKSRFEGGAR